MKFIFNNILFTKNHDFLFIFIPLNEKKSKLFCFFFQHYDNLFDILLVFVYLLQTYFYICFFHILFLCDFSLFILFSSLFIAFVYLLQTYFYVCFFHILFLDLFYFSGNFLYLFFAFSLNIFLLLL